MTEQPEPVAQPAASTAPTEPPDPPETPEASASTAAVSSAPGADAADEPATEPATGPARRRRFPVALVAAVVGLGLIAGGGVWGWSAVQDADRSAPTTVWAEPGEHTEPEEPSLKPTGLAADLLPMPIGYLPGPDVDEFGNDSVLDAERAVALFKEGARGLPGKQRRQHQKAVDELGIKGVAVRSYRPEDASFVMEIRLAQLENTKAVRNIAEFDKQVAEAFEIFRKGPKIPGHPKATCYLLPEDDEVELDVMLCSAPVGEVLVNVYAYGVKDLRTGTIKDLVREQLDHITSPGEAV
ncbi:hypothetical protein AB0957_17225 [Streptomyces zhihengii]|uniref:hypothetical protein n=1 Tax=Streptomyces zhihengii TaxID=1818004 RepID=UPI00345549C3